LSFETTEPRTEETGKEETVVGGDGGWRRRWIEGTEETEEAGYKRRNRAAEDEQISSL
jgi:hypothetical protein